MFALFFDNGTWALDSMVSEGLKENTLNSIPVQAFWPCEEKDKRLRQILVNHHIAASPEPAEKAPKPRERNLKRKANE